MLIVMDRPTPYDEDFYAWSREQADVLRGLAERRDLPNALDLEHVIEERVWERSGVPQSRASSA
jgi:uncharacterized protein DUF29